MEFKLPISFLTLVLTFLVSLLLPAVLFAQESELGPREYHHVENHSVVPSNEALENDEVLLEDEEKNSSRVSSNNSFVRDSIATKVPLNANRQLKIKNANESQKSLTDQKPVEKNNEEEEKEDDSILSFNFLYYIFQKFKLSDIVDK